jgi:hypothetical protein
MTTAQDCLVFKRADERPLVVRDGFGVDTVIEVDYWDGGILEVGFERVD